MKKPDRGPDYKEPHYPAGRNDLPPIWLREIKRKDLKKDPYRVRLMYKKPDGTEGSHDALNWIAARAYARKLNKELEEGRAVGTGGMKFERVWNEWFEKRDTDVQLGELRPSTVRGDRFLAVHVLGEFGKKRLDKILSIDVENWAKAQMIEKGWKVSYADRSVLKMFQVLDYAVRKRYLVFNPLRQDPVRLRKPLDDRPWVPQWDLMDRLIEAGTGPKRPVKCNRIVWANLKMGIVLSAGTSLRCGELLALRWDDVDFAERVIRVRKNATRNDGIGPLKTPASRRDVQMCQWVYEALLEHAHTLKTLNDYGRGRTRLRAAANPGQGFILRNGSSPNKPVENGNWYAAFNKFLRDAKFVQSPEDKVNWRWHAFRRFYISARLAMGADFMTVGEQVGHRDASITARTYARALPEPPPIWRYRFSPAAPEARVIDATATAGLLPPPAEEVNGAAGLPDWGAEAVRLLKGGWRVGDVVIQTGKARHSLNRLFRQLGLPTPRDMYLAARNQRYEQLHAEGYLPLDIATMTGTHIERVMSWRRTYEADVPMTEKSLKSLRKSDQKAKPKATGRQQTQLNLFGT